MLFSLGVCVHFFCFFGGACALNTTPPHPHKYNDNDDDDNNNNNGTCSRSDAVSAKNTELHRVTAALDDATAQLEARGASLADASPLVRLKAALSRMRGEIKAMELRIGVAGSTLLSLSLQQRQQQERQAALAAGGGFAAAADAARSRGSLDVRAR
jgi:hypothetical protein